MCQYPRADVSSGICDECRQKHGIPEPTGSQRPPEPCGRCGHFVLVRVRLRERSAEIGADIGSAEPAPLAATFGIDRRRSFWSGDHAHTNVAQPIGLMQAYICRKCGFSEIYTSDPQDIPIGEEFATELVDLTPGDGDDGPYR